MQKAKRPYSNRMTMIFLIIGISMGSFQAFRIWYTNQKHEQELKDFYSQKYNMVNFAASITPAKQAVTVTNPKTDSELQTLCTELLPQSELRQFYSSDFSVTATIADHKCTFSGPDNQYVTIQSVTDSSKSFYDSATTYGTDLSTLIMYGANLHAGKKRGTAPQSVIFAYAHKDGTTYAVEFTIPKGKTSVDGYTLIFKLLGKVIGQSL